MEALFKKEFKRLDLIDRIEELRDNITDIENVVMKQNMETNDKEIKELEARVLEIQKQISDLMK